MWSRETAVCLVTKLWSWTFLDPISGRHKKYFPNLKRPHRLCGSLSNQFSAYRSTLSGFKAAVPWSLPLTSMQCHTYAVTDRSGTTFCLHWLGVYLTAVSIPQIVWREIKGCSADNKQASTWKQHGNVYLSIRYFLFLVQWKLVLTI
jgi:hypothetical protein